jgi:hypothetical protein
VSKAGTQMKHPIFSSSMISSICSLASFWVWIDEIGGTNVIILLMGTWPSYLYNSTSETHGIMVDSYWWKGRWPYILFIDYTRVMIHLCFFIFYALDLWFPSTINILCSDHNFLNVIINGKNWNPCYTYVTVSFPTAQLGLG